MEEDKIKKLGALLDERTMQLMERESDLADRLEEIHAQKEELNAAIDEVTDKNNKLMSTLAVLEERNKELDQILYRASHDLRSPISSIIGILGLLNKEALTEFQFDCVKHIDEKSAQMDDIIKSLSALAKTITNDVHFCRFNLKELVSDCLNDPTLKKQLESFILELNFTGKLEVNSDRLLLGIVINNLLSNAITFRDSLKTGKITIHGSVYASSFEISITDDGEGIPAEIKNKIFTMFYRGSEKSSGSGLGLYIVKKIIEQLKGEIDVISTNKETTFTIKLPIAII